MKNSIIQLLDDNHIAYKLRGEWANVCCPHCLDSNFHLGIAPTGSCTCFKCGRHTLESTLHALLSCGFVEAKKTAKLIRHKEDKEINALNSMCVIPSSGVVMPKAPYTYLHNRFKHLTDTEMANMVSAYGITYTDMAYNDLLYANRIIFPNYLGGTAVSFQGRDWTGDAKTKYMTPKKEDEVVHHKDFLWGIDKVPYDKVVVCEGVFDALTIGQGAVHTHGVKFSFAQAQALLGFSHVYICYDMDKPGRDQAKSLSKLLCHRTKVSIVRLSEHDVNTCSKSEIEDIKALIC